MFGWLRRREGKRAVAERAEPEPIDPLAELLRLVGETEPDRLSKGADAKAKKAQPTSRRYYGRC